MHELRFLYAEKENSKATTHTGNSVLCHDAARQLGKDIPHRVEDSAISTDVLQRFNVSYFKRNLRTVTSWNYGSLQERRHGEMLNGNTQNGKFCRPTCISYPVHRISVLEMRLCGTLDKNRIALHIAEGTVFTWSRNGSGAMVGFALSRFA